MRDSINSFVHETLTCVPAHTDHLIPDFDQVLGNLIRVIPRDAPHLKNGSALHPSINLKNLLKRTLKNV